MLAKFPEPDGTGGESILGLPGKPDLSEWQIVRFESQCGFVTPGANVRGPPLPSAMAPRWTAQPGYRRKGCSGPMPFIGFSASHVRFYLTSAEMLFKVDMNLNHTFGRAGHGNV